MNNYKRKIIGLEAFEICKKNTSKVVNKLL